jgi:Na+/H+-dicarboxylate symporter
MKSNFFYRFFNSKVGLITLLISSTLGIAILTPASVIHIKRRDEFYSTLSVIMIALMICTIIGSITRLKRLKRL